MEKLFVDEFITRKGFSSTEEYIKNYISQRVPWIEFPNLDYYLSLFENDFLRIGNGIRTSDRGSIDEFYQIIENGMLRGVTEINAHQGMKEIFSPKEILKGKRISANWSTHFQTLEKNIYLKNPNSPSVNHKKIDCYPR
ncbi:hypothetical protein M0R72_04200 [Candidatus Pacearchaeota archaeon]|nr:hypothetical protein [Candidatus Pacearchaeota archaeon]